MALVVCSEVSQLLVVAQAVPMVEMASLVDQAGVAAGPAARVLQVHLDKALAEETATTPLIWNSTSMSQVEVVVAAARAVAQGRQSQDMQKGVQADGLGRGLMVSIIQQAAAVLGQRSAVVPVMPLAAVVPAMVEVQKGHQEPRVQPIVAAVVVLDGVLELVDQVL
jgi:hypothetical protein